MGHRRRRALTTPELAFVVQELGVYSPLGNVPTLLKPGSRLLSRVAEHAISLDDIGRREGEELVVLRTTKDDDANVELAEYIDTAETRTYRAEVRRINTSLVAADIIFED